MHSVQVQVSSRASCRRHHSPPSSYIPPNHTWTLYTQLEDQQVRPIYTPTVRSATTATAPGRVEADEGDPWQQEAWRLGSSPSPGQGPR